MKLTHLTDAGFAWLLDEAPAPADAPRLPPGSIADRAVLGLLRRHAAQVGGEAAWLMIADGEAVGIISIKERDARGRWDIGYGVAPSREGRGHATAAVTALKQVAQRAGVGGLTAETLPDSGASPAVLRRNGFICTGQFDHPEDGIVDQWLVEWTR